MSTGPTLAGSSVTLGFGRCRSPCTLSILRPFLAIASRWAPRAMKKTSWPAAAMRAPKYPPTAPAAIAAIRMCFPLLNMGLPAVAAHTQAHKKWPGTRPGHSREVCEKASSGRKAGCGPKSPVRGFETAARRHSISDACLTCATAVCGSTITFAPTCTRLNRSITSSLVSRMQPLDTCLPMVLGALVPWMRYCGAADIHGARAERIARAARGHARQIRLARKHLGRRIPVRPFGLALDRSSRPTR